MGKKKHHRPLKEKKAMIETNNPYLSINKQCQILGLAKSSLYYSPSKESEFNLKLMRVIDRIYLKYPHYGSRQITQYIRKDLGIEVNRKRIQRLMRYMGIAGIAPKRNLSKKSKENPVYPYLLKGLKVDRVHQVWTSDITYIPVSGGSMFLVAIMDLHSRCILSWRLSNSLDVSFCIEALEEALGKYGSPEIFHSDQGCQYTSHEFTGILSENGVRISMTGKGRAQDNIMIERFWRTLKYEEVYPKGYADISVPQVYQLLEAYLAYYNYTRRHSSLDYEAPWFYMNREANNYTNKKEVLITEV